MRTLVLGLISILLVLSLPITFAQENPVVIPSCEKSADLNQDGKKNIFDLILLIRPHKYNPDFDLNCDNVINVFDIHKWLQLLTKKMPVITPSPTPDPYDNWKTYINNTGFSLKYPANLLIGEQGWGTNRPPSQYTDLRIHDKQEPFINPHVDINVWVNSSLDLKSEAEKNYNKNINHRYLPAKVTEEFHQTTFLNQLSYEYTLKNKGVVGDIEEYLGFDGEYKFIWTKYNNNIYIIILTKTPEMMNILSSFKFN